MSKKFVILSILTVGLTALGLVWLVASRADSLPSGTNNPEIQSLNQSIQSAKDRIDAIKKQQAIYQAQLEQKRGEHASLNNEIAILDDSIAQAQLDIDGVNANLDKLSLEIKVLNINILDLSDQVERNKTELSTALKLLNQEDGKTSLEVLLSNDYLSDYLEQVQYIKNINSSIGDKLESLKTQQQSLADQKSQLNQEKSGYDQLKAEMDGKQQILVQEQDNKQTLLAQTRSSENAFQKLYNKSVADQRQAENEASSLEAKVREKLAAQSNNKLTSQDAINTSASLIWPVPKNNINAYFHDPDYPFRNVFEHPGIDIRAAQGTALHAAASGYVARAKYGTNGSYGYIMIVHANNIATVYGHVSRIDVKEDQYVQQGDLIGASGAMPGTDGAAPFTTGPHLHFEVRLNGIPVNPLGYLP